MGVGKWHISVSLISNGGKWHTSVSLISNGGVRSYSFRNEWGRQMAHKCFLN